MYVAIDTTDMLFITSGTYEVCSKYCEAHVKNWWIVFDNDNKNSYRTFTTAEQKQLFTNSVDDPLPSDLLSGLQAIGATIDPCPWSLLQLNNLLFKQKTDRENFMAKLRANAPPISVPVNPPSRPAMQQSAQGCGGTSAPLARPAGGLTGKVWEICDTLFEKGKDELDLKGFKRRAAQIADVRGINPSTFSVQFSKWASFNGIKKS